MRKAENLATYLSQVEGADGVGEQEEDSERPANLLGEAQALLKLMGEHQVCLCLTLAGRRGFSLTFYCDFDCTEECTRVAGPT